MERPIIDKYFAKKGINVRFNTLGYDETLIRAFVKDFQLEVSSSYRKKSQDVKHACYNKLYPVKSRPKFTGFETLKIKEKQFRKDISPFITASQFSPLFSLEHNENEQIELSYKDVLVNSVKSIENPIVYLSGGMDSEIVANAFIEANKKFVPMIFYYVDEKGELLNKHDIGYAYAFCKKHGLFPIIKQIDLPKLWDSLEFKKLAIDIQLNSPQLTTYAHMVNLVNQEFPNHTHIFGGEVRFNSDYNADSRDYNIVFLDKVLPAYSGIEYAVPSIFGNAMYIFLNYNANSLDFPGYWDVTYVEGLGGIPFTIDSGVWTTTPASAYEARIPALTIFNQQGGGFYSPLSVPSSWFSISSTGTTLCLVASDACSFGGCFNQRNILFNIEVRVVGETTPVQLSSIQLNATTQTA